MPGKKLLLYTLYIAVIASLTAFKLCDGQADEADAERPSVQGSHHIRSVLSGRKLEPAAQTRPGSLVFKHGQLDDLNSTNVVHDTLDAKLKRMDPSVKCGENMMTLTVKPTGASHFLVDSGEQPLTPLSQMPSTCGFSVKRSRRDVQYDASYQGCHVDKKDGDYVLPLRLWGAPMSMSCPSMLPLPYIFCFPSMMVVKIGGVPAKEFKVKVSGAWQPLSSAYSVCGLTFQELSGELTLIVPYSRGSCIEIKDEEYVLSLHWADFELMATCPPVLHMDHATETTASPNNSDQVPQHPQYPYLSMFSQYMEPVPTHKQTAAVPVAHPQLPVKAADYTENQEMPKPQHPAFSFKPQLPQFVLFPRPELQMKPSGNENAAALQVQLHQIPRHEIPALPQIPMMPGIFQATTPSPPATGSAAFVTMPVPTTEHKGKPQVALQPQFPVLPQYPFLPFPKQSSSTEDQTEAIIHPNVIQQPKPQHLHPQTFQIPMLYPLDHPSSRQNTRLQTPAPATTSTVATTEPPAEKPLYHPHPFMPVYLIPNQASVPAFLDSPAVHPTNPAPSDQQHQPVFRVMPPLFFPS